MSFLQLASSLSLGRLPDFQDLADVNWEDLAPSLRLELAFLILSVAKDINENDSLFFWIEKALEIGENASSLIYLSATLLSVRKQWYQCHLLLSQIPFEKLTESQLSLSIHALYELSLEKNEETFLDSALELCQFIPQGSSFAELHWMHAKCLALVAKHSQELSDYKAAFREFECTWILISPNKRQFVDADWALAYLDLADITGQKEFAEIGIKKIEPSLSTLGSREWLITARLYAKIYELTGLQSDFKEADAFFNQAIFYVNGDLELWLVWAHLHFKRAFLELSIDSLEEAFDKISFEGVRHRFPVAAPLISCKGLALLGLLSENLTLIIKAKEQISKNISQESAFCEGIQLAYFGENKALPFEPKGEELLLLAYRIVHNADLEQALLYVKELVRIRPNHAYYTYLLAHTFLKKGIQDSLSIADLEEALVLFDKSYSMGFEEPALVYKAHCLSCIGLYYSEVAYLEESCRLFSTFDSLSPGQGLLRGRAFIQLAKVKKSRRFLDIGMEELQRYVLFDESDSTVWLSIGYCYLLAYSWGGDRQDLLNSEPHLIRALKMGAQKAYYFLACYFSLKGILKKSLVFLQKALSYGVIGRLEEAENEPWLEGLIESPWYSLAAKSSSH